MKAFNMIFVAAYAFCICLQTGVLGNGAALFSIRHSEKKARIKTEQKKCKRLSQKSAVLCANALDFPDISNFPYYDGKSLEEKTGAPCQNSRDPHIYKLFEKDFIFDDEIEIKYFFWRQNEKCLTKKVANEAREKNIEVIYTQEYLQDFFLEHAFPLDSKKFKSSNNHFGRIINYNMRWNNTAKIFKNQDEFRSKDGKVLFKTNFLGLKAQATYKDDDVIAAKVPFAGNKNLSALFVQAKDSFNLSPKKLIPKLVKRNDGNEEIVKIPMGSFGLNYFAYFARCPFDLESEPNQGNLTSDTFARIDFNTAGIGAEADTSPEIFIDPPNPKTFNQNFDIHFMHGNDLTSHFIPFFSPKVLEVKC